MNSHDDRMQRILAEALSLPPAEREAFLDRECGGDAGAKAEILRMVAAGADTETLPVQESKIPRIPLQKVLAGRFRVVRFIAAGGMGDVYEVEDLQLGEPAALKTIRRETVGNAPMLARFKREIQYAKRVTHPNVCRIYDLGSHSEGDSEILFLTMELLRGETLSHRLRRSGRIAPAEALPLIVQMAEGLAAAHEAGIIHRDFKTSNVMLTGADSASRAVVTDFGLARPSAVGDDSSLTESGRLVGTPLYMAPEQLTRDQLTPATDVYALGLVIYETITGARPFSGDTPAASALMRLTHKPPSASERLPGLDPLWEAAVMRCLERDPARRFQSPKDVVRALTEDPGRTRTLTGARLTGEWFRARPSRKRWGAALVVALALLAAAFAGVWLLGRHRPPADAVRWYEEGTRALRDGTAFTAMNALERAVQLDPGFTLAHARLAEAATELDYMDKAKTEMLRASSPAHRPYFVSREEKLRLEAIYFVLDKDFAQAAARYKDLAAKVTEAERPAVLVDLGRAYEGGGKFPEALASYTDSIARDRQFAAAFLRRAVLEGRQLMNAKAAADFDAAEQLYRTEGKTEGLIEVMYQRATLLRRTGRLAEARAPSQMALDMARASGDDNHQIRALLALSQLSYSSGDTDTGQQQAQQARDLAQKAGVEVLAASGLVDIGNALFTKGDYAAAEPYLRNAIETAMRFQAVRIAARAQVALGQVLANEGRTQDGLALIEQAGESFRQAGEKSNAARAAIPGARMLRDRGDYAASATLFRHQLQLAEQVKDDGGITLAALGLGSVLLLQEQYPAALPQFERSAAVSRELADQSSEAYSEALSAEALWRLGRYSEADERLKSAEGRSKGNKPLLASIYNSRAMLDLSRRSFPAAEEDIRGMMGAGVSVPQTVVVKRLMGLALVSTGRLREGRALCEESVRLAQAARNIPSLRNSELALAEARLDSGDRAGALALTPTLLTYFAGQSQFESELRALAVSYSASGGADKTQYAETAKATLDKLRQQFGVEAFTRFESRPDIRQIIRRAGLLMTQDGDRVHTGVK